MYYPSPTVIILKGWGDEVARTCNPKIRQAVARGFRDGPNWTIQLEQEKQRTKKKGEGGVLKGGREDKLLTFNNECNLFLW